MKIVQHKVPHLLNAYGRKKQREFNRRASGTQPIKNRWYKCLGKRESKTDTNVILLSAWPGS